MPSPEYVPTDFATLFTTARFDSASATSSSRSAISAAVFVLDPEAVNAAANAALALRTFVL